MTLQEVAQQLGKSENTIYKNFRRTQETLLKKGIILTRWGPDEYEIEYEEADMTYLEEKQRKAQIEYHKRKLQELEEQGE
jgi:transposase